MFATPMPNHHDGSTGVLFLGYITWQASMVSAIDEAIKNKRMLI